MRINSLNIKSNWKNLENFQIDFNENRDISVIIGKNGAAKSNLLEAIILIFTALDLAEPAPFSYELTYTINSKKVRLTSDSGKQPKGEIDGSSVALQEIRDSWTPHYVVGYYSGASNRFLELFAQHDLKARDLTLAASTNGSETKKLELRRFICARPEHGLYALLAFYVTGDEEAKKFLKALPRIEGFDSALLTVHKPSWAKKGDGPENFWGAKGPVRDLLECIRRHSLAPFSKVTRIKRNFVKFEQVELVYLYLPNIKALQAVAAEYGDDARSFFQALDTMHLSDLIEDFKVRVSVAGSSGVIHTRQLSEGEQQLITVLGLMRFTRNVGSLYLLDEPDTHLNPSWELEYLSRLRSVGGIERESHTILATHNPLLVAGLCKEEIRALVRKTDGTVVAVQPEEDPRGTGVAGVLTSPLYGLESQLDKFSLDVLKRIYEISLTDKSAYRTRHLRRLRRLLPALNTAETSPDPYRNIARDAYQLAQNIILNSDQSGERKLRAIEELAKKLAGEALGEME
jgi:predicted ATPase